MSCGLTERRQNNRAAGPQGGGGPGGPAGSACRLRGTGTNNAAATNARGSTPITTAPQNGPQPSAQGPPLRAKPCCLLWCCCCKCPCSNPGGKASEENGPNINSNNSDLMVNCELEPPPTLEEVRNWGRSFDKLMKSAAGRQVFRDFLRVEYSEENILFWLACEELKRETNLEVVEEKARIIYEDFISILSPREVSLDARVREIVNRNMVEPTPQMFEEAQLQIYTLMHRDSYPRFINSPLYRSLSQQQSGSSDPEPDETTAMVNMVSEDQEA
ncbi:regulator of G-protein signaling 17 [Diabrotica virgifera virgifera]|uniref:RGS domain-containing protein n=3 Tax=Diabrotica virgifera virgifera TaxID=50390 RepID=A0ABM5JHA8_DIAVI|nr:regulator of G-protein signaling 17 [Diabrotica virgifera virgifera]